MLLIRQSHNQEFLPAKRASIYIFSNYQKVIVYFAVKALKIINYDLECLILQWQSVQLIDLDCIYLFSCIHSKWNKQSFQPLPKILIQNIKGSNNDSSQQGYDSLIKILTLAIIFSKKTVEIKLDFEKPDLFYFFPLNKRRQALLMSQIMQNQQRLKKLAFPSIFLNKLKLTFYNIFHQKHQMSQRPIKIKQFSLEEYRNFGANDIKYFDIQVPFRLQEKECIIYRKKRWEEFKELKTFMCMPGTAFIHHNMVNYDATFSVLLETLPEDYQIIIPLQPLAPENTFPKPILSIQSYTQNILGNPSKYRFNPSKTVFGGYSSGGSMVPPIAIELAKKGIVFNATLMISSALDYSGSLQQNDELTKRWKKYEIKDHPKMNHSFIDFMNHHYCNSKEELFHPWYSAIFTPENQLKYLSRPHFIYGEYDFMRRTIEQFKSKLVKNGIKEQTQILSKQNHLIMILVQSGLEKKQIALKQRIEKLEIMNTISKCIQKILK